MFKKIINFLGRLYQPTISEECLLKLKKNREIIDKNIQIISSEINNSEKDDFFLEPDNKFYNYSPHMQARIIQEKIGLASISCPIKYSHRRIFGSAVGRFIQKKNLTPFLNPETKTLEFEKDDMPKIDIEIDSKLRGNSFMVAGVLAHEMTHLYFYSKNLSTFFPDQQTEEQCCDLTMFLLGLGKLALNTISQETTSIRLRDYLEWYDFCYIYEKINKIKNIPAEISRKNLNVGAKTALSMITENFELLE